MILVPLRSLVQGIKHTKFTKKKTLVGETSYFMLKQILCTFPSLFPDAKEITPVHVFSGQITSMLDSIVKLGI